MSLFKGEASVLYLTFARLAYLRLLTPFCFSFCREGCGRSTSGGSVFMLSGFPDLFMVLLRRLFRMVHIWRFRLSAYR